MYGHVEKLAQEIKKGAESIEGVEAKLWQVCKSIIRTNKVSIIL
jgi:NAD(P)H dehydrogenase (quinone)